MLSTLNGQKKWDIRTNGGIASGRNVIDGYYFSFDIGIPLGKALQLAPTFSFADMLPNTYFENNWSAFYPSPDTGVPNGGPRQEDEFGENLSSVSLLLIFKPFDLFLSEKLNKHELMIGAGYSLNSYTMVSSQYVINEDGYDLTSFSVKSNKTLEPYYCKVGYNYLFKENLAAGVVAGFNGFDGEAILLAGVQLEVKF